MGPRRPSAPASGAEESAGTALAQAGRRSDHDRTAPASPKLRTLRLRLIALIVALAALLAVGEWALVRALSAELEGELASAAASVGRDVLRALRSTGLIPPHELDAPAGDGKPRTARIEQRVVVFHHPPAGPDAGKAPRADVQRPEARALPPLPEPSAGTSPPASGGARVGERVEVVEDRLEVSLEPVTARVLLLRSPGTGTQRLPVPTSGVEEAVERFTRRLLLASFGLLGGALVLGVFVAHRFTRPLRDLAAAARQVGEGELGLAAPAAPGEVGEAIAAFNQMSARLRELDLETRRLRASEQLSELGEVGRGLAHGLRNPLNALGLAVDELARQAGTGEAVETAEAARRQIRRVDAALRGFLALSAGDAAPAAVDLTAVARDVALESLQSRPGGAAVPVDVVAGDGALVVQGVEAELRAALQALVVNAVEASPSGGRVRVALQRDGDGLAVTVEDGGAGLPEAVRARLFTPHVTTKPAGAGIGLYLAHRVATTRYGGELRLEDRPGGGTRATLRLRDRGTVGGEGAPCDPASVPREPEDAGGG